MLLLLSKALPDEDRRRPTLIQTGNPDFNVVLGVGSKAADWNRDGEGDGLELAVKLVRKLPVKIDGSFTVEAYEYDFDRLDHRGGLIKRWQATPPDPTAEWEEDFLPFCTLKLKWDGRQPDGQLVLVDVAFTDDAGNTAVAVDNHVRLLPE
jgi:hypothetical protein